MDTDDFSEMAYNIIVQAARLSDTLETELGALSRNHKNENDWLRAVQELCREIIADPDAYVDFWNLVEEERITAQRISEIAGLLSAQVDIVLAVPLINRGPEFNGI